MSQESASFEDLALRQGLVSAAQVEECRRLREKMAADGVELSVEEVLLKKGWITREQAASLKGGKTAIDGYEILGKIGEGGMGAVYKARQTSLDRLVAIKVLLRQHTKDKEGVERFVREAKALAKLSHPNIVSGIDAGVSNGVYYYVMELLEGEPLSRRLKLQGALPWKQAAGVARQVAAALEHACHHRIIHRDIKPGNIILLKDGTVKVADFGMARFTVASSLDLTHSGQVMGTPLYMSPEQARAEELDIRTDLYALGITLFEMLTGKPPYTGDNPLAVLSRHVNESVPWRRIKDVPADLLGIGERLTERDRERRYGGPLDLLRDLESVEQGKTPEKLRAAQPKTRRANPTTLAPRVQLRRKPRKKLVLGLSAAGAALVALLALALSGSPTPPAAAPAPAPKPVARPAVEEPPPQTDADRRALKAYRDARAYEEANPKDLEEIAAQYAALAAGAKGTLYAERARERAEETRALLEVAVKRKRAEVESELAKEPTPESALLLLDRHARAFKQHAWTSWIAERRKALDGARAAKRPDPPKPELPAPGPRVEAPVVAAPVPVAEDSRVLEFADAVEPLAAKRQYEKIEPAAPKLETPKGRELLDGYLAGYRLAREVHDAALAHAQSRQGKDLAVDLRDGRKISGILTAHQGTTFLVGEKTFGFADLSSASLVALYRAAKGAQAKPEAIVAFAVLDGALPLAEDLLRRSKVEPPAPAERILRRLQLEKEADAALKAAERLKGEAQADAWKALVTAFPATKAAAEAKKKLDALAVDVVVHAAELPESALNSGMSFHRAEGAVGGRYAGMADEDEGIFAVPPDED